MVDGYSFLEELSWDAFNESGGLIQAAERYRNRYGYYPEAILADRIYRNRENLKFCQKHNIRFSGPRLGRPSFRWKGKALRTERQDNRERNAIEGKFGEEKRSYGLSRIMARLPETAACVIALQFLVMNLEHRLRVLFTLFWDRLISGMFYWKPAELLR